ncbi:hypothetical protein LDENG_00069870, partial [Lucifuga dentata]
VVQEYERCVIFRLGRILKGQAKGPGLFWIIPWLDAIQKVDLRTISFKIPPQEVLTADSVPLKVDGVMFYRIADPILWVTRVSNGFLATHTLAQTALRATLGVYTLEDILMQRRGLAQRMEEVLDSICRMWGVQVERVEIKDLTLPCSLQRCMASEAEAVREARAKVIEAEGELKASLALKAAAAEFSSVALQLRYLQSLNSISTKTSVIVFPWPKDLQDTSPSHHSHA